MKEARDFRPLTSPLTNGTELTPEVVALLVAEAFSQAHVAMGAIEARVIPSLPPQTRSFAFDLLRRIERMEMFDDRFLRDLQSIASRLRERIEAGTSRYWQSDEHHIYGGYEIIDFSREAKTLAAALYELETLRERLIVALSAARAVRELDGFVQL